MFSLQNTQSSASCNIDCGLQKHNSETHSRGITRLMWIIAHCITAQAMERWYWLEKILPPPEYSGTKWCLHCCALRANNTSGPGFQHKPHQEHFQEGTTFSFTKLHLVIIAEWSIPLSTMRAACKHYWWLTGFTHQPTLSWLFLGGRMFGRSWRPPASPHVLQTSLCSNAAKLHQKAVQYILQDAIHNLIPDIVRVHAGIMIGSGCDFNNNNKSMILIFGVILNPTMKALMTLVFHYDH